jgi:hypothetical protein
MSGELSGYSKEWTETSKNSHTMLPSLKEPAPVNRKTTNRFVVVYNLNVGARGRVVVKALCYKVEGRGFDTRWGNFFLFT